MKDYILNKNLGKLSEVTNVIVKCEGLPGSGRGLVLAIIKEALINTGARIQELNDPEYSVLINYQNIQCSPK